MIQISVKDKEKVLEAIRKGTIDAADAVAEAVLKNYLRDARDPK